MSRYEYASYESEGHPFRLTHSLNAEYPEGLICEIAEKLLTLGDGRGRVRQVAMQLEELVQKKERGIARAVADKLDDEPNHNYAFERP